MRRLVALLAVAGIAFAGVAALTGQRGYGGSGYTVDAIFDQASGLIPQNNVMIAGAKVGIVTGISLTSNYQARVHMQIDRRYAPFYADARCQIRPVALIGEMEVNCDPGTAASGLLRATRGEPPTVPVAMTTVPVDLTDLFDIWSAPVSQRVSIVLWTLGAGLAGRGEDLNGVLERSNPTLMLARQTITTLDDQRAALQSLLDGSDRLLARVAPDRSAAQQFVAHAASVAEITAAHRGALAQSVQRLPALLGAARPALAQLQLVATDATPVLGDLRDAAPGLNRTVADVVPLVDAARPALSAVSLLSRRGLRALPSLTPLASELTEFAHAGLPVASLLSALFTNMQQRGFIEGLNDFPYYVGSSLARFDATSHLSASNFLTSLCGGSNESAYAACSARYGAPVASASASVRGRRTSARSSPGVPARQPAHPAPPSSQDAPAPTAGTAAPTAAGQATAAAQTLKSLIAYLLK